jgi:hypothetical protein
MAKGWNRTDDRWLAAAGDISRATLNRFLKGDAVKQATFMAICQAVGIEQWQQIRQAGAEPEPGLAARVVAMPRPVTGEALEQFAKALRAWFGALHYEIEPNPRQTADYFEWLVRIPVRSRFDRILLRGIVRETSIVDLQEMQAGIQQWAPDEAWLVTDYLVSPAVVEWAERQRYRILCLTFDELIDQDVDFRPYIDWLNRKVQELGIAEDYLQLSCTKPEIDPQTQHYLGTSRYGAPEGGVEGYIDRWLEAPEKNHLSILGEFGTGKTWFTLHYAWQELQKYQVAKQKKMRRPRLPLVMQLRTYAKAANVENVLADFFFAQHGIRLNNAVFERLNEMGRLLLIFDGFDEMAEKTNRQKMADHFWQLAQVAILGSKVILTSRKEHFPEDGDARQIFGGRVLPSQEFRLVAPTFEILELALFDLEQIRQKLSKRTAPETVAAIIDHPELLDLARRPVMGDLLVLALRALQADLRQGRPVNTTRVY